MNEYWKNLRPFEKRVVVGVMALLFVVFNVWVVMPHFSDWTKVQYRMAAAQKKLGIYKNEIAQKPRYDAEIKKMEGDALSIPQEDQSVQFLRTVQTHATQSQIGITGTSKQQAKTNQFFLELSQTFTLQAGEQQLVDFLYNLGSSNSLIRVREMTLRPDQPRQALNATVKLVASYQKKAPTRAAASATVAAQKATNNVPKTPIAGPRPTQKVTNQISNTNKVTTPPGKKLTVQPIKKS
jgi:hypothetical protein